MPLLRPTIAFSSLTRRAASAGTRQPRSMRQFSLTRSRLAQGYGDGEGDPKGETPQHQGSSNATKHDAEHPGPSPPSEGKGTGAGPTKADSGKSPEESSAQSGGARSKEAKETGYSPTGGSVGNSGGKSSAAERNKTGPSPKIHDKAVPGQDDAEKQAEVDKHNEEFYQGHDRAPPAAEDAGDKKFWKGQGGSDKQP